MTILSMAADAGVTLDPEHPWEHLAEMRREARLVKQLARQLRKKPEDVTAAVEDLVSRLDAVDAELAMRRGWPL